MRRYICCHSYGNTGASVYQKRRNPCRENNRFSSFFIKVRRKVNRIFIYIFKQNICKLAHSCFRISVCSRGISVHGSKVSVTVYERVSHGKILSKSYHSVIYGCISVRMISTYNITYGCSRFKERLINGKVFFIHRIEYSSVYGLQTVSDIRQSSAHDYAHCIIYEGFLHSFFYIYIYNRLIFKMLFKMRLFVIFVFCHIYASVWVLYILFIYQDLLHTAHFLL